MKNVTLVLLAGAAALFAGSANAADIFGESDQPVLRPLQTVCNEDGRCYRTQGERRVVIQRDPYEYRDRSEYYAPRERYIERPGYHDGDDRPRPRAEIWAPGMGERRVMTQRDPYEYREPSDYYAPRERYIERPMSHDGEDGPRPRAGIWAPGAEERW
jgi:hypothetical protein